MAKILFANEKERAAYNWAISAYGRGWKKHFSVDLAAQEKSFPYQNLRFHCARPFGRRDWNLYVQWLRVCLHRNTYFPEMSRKMRALV